MSGCRHTYNWADKRTNEYADYLCKMGEEMGRMWDEHKDEIIQIRLSPSHWELAPEDTAYENVWVCSNCGEDFTQHRKPKFIYCPHCGAKMDEEIEDGCV